MFLFSDLLPDANSNGNWTLILDSETPKHIEPMDKLIVSIGKPICSIGIPIGPTGELIGPIGPMVSKSNGTIQLPSDSAAGLCLIFNDPLCPTPPILKKHVINSGYLSLSP